MLTCKTTPTESQLHISNNTRGHANAMTGIHRKKRNTLTTLADLFNAALKDKRVLPSKDLPGVITRVPTNPQKAQKMIENLTAVLDAAGLLPKEI